MFIGSSTSATFHLIVKIFIVIKKQIRITKAKKKERRKMVGRHVRDRMVIGFTSTYVISAYLF